MNTTKNLPGHCQHCDGAFEFVADQIGQSTTCPHCSQPIELSLAEPSENKPAVPAKAILFTIIAVLILAGGLIASQLAIRRARRLTARDHKPTATPATALADPFSKAGFQVSEVKLEKARNGSLVFGVGSIVETARRKRFGVRVELALCDRDGKKIGVAKDYQAALEAGATWQFRALIMEPRTVRASVIQITEDQ